MNWRIHLAARRYSLRWGMAYAMAVGALLWLLLSLFGCASQPPRTVSLNWLASPNVAATCASMGMAARDGVCVRADGDRCLLVTGREGVDMAALGKSFREECVR